MIFLEIVLLVIGMVLLIKGADFFVDGSSKIAKALHIPALIIGLTLVSMGTSAPELAVSITSGIQGNNDMSLGNVVGSNTFNTFLILGLSSVVIPLIIDKDMKKFDIPIMLGIYALLLLFGFVVTPNSLDRFEAIIFLVLFVIYIITLLIRAKKSNNEVQEEAEAEPASLKKLIVCLLLCVAGVVSLLDFAYNNYIIIGMFVLFLLTFLLKEKQKDNQASKKEIIFSVIFTIAGLVSIIGGSELVVNNASALASRLGMSDALVGLTIVAIGTSLPELITSVVAAMKKENDIAVGNVIGSNIFNALLILGATSAIKPLALSSESLFDLVVLFISGLLVFIISRFSNNMKKWQGVIFVILYVSYLAFIIIRNYM